MGRDEGGIGKDGVNYVCSFAYEAKQNYVCDQPWETSGYNVICVGEPYGLNLFPTPHFWTDPGFALVSDRNRICLGANGDHFGVGNPNNTFCVGNPICGGNIGC